MIKFSSASVATSQMVVRELEANKADKTLAVISLIVGALALGLGIVHFFV